MWPTRVASVRSFRCLILQLRGRQNSREGCDLGKECLSGFVFASWQSSSAMRLLRHTLKRDGVCLNGTRVGTQLGRWDSVRVPTHFISAACPCLRAGIDSFWIFHFSRSSSLRSSRLHSFTFRPPPLDTPSTSDILAYICHPPHPSICTLSPLRALILLQPTESGWSPGGAAVDGENGRTPPRRERSASPRRDEDRDRNMEDGDRRGR